jgi:pyruvate, water dikinase
LRAEDPEVGRRESGMGFWSRLFPSTRADERDALRLKYERFRSLLAANNEILEMITDLEGVLAGSRQMRLEEVRGLLGALHARVTAMVGDLNVIAEQRYRALDHSVERIAAGIEEEFRQVHGVPVTRPCIPLEEISRELCDAVGGKTSNLGEVQNRVGLPVPAGFAVTAFAYRSFVDGSGLQPRLTALWDAIRWEDRRSVAAASAEMTRLVQEAQIPREVAEEIALAAHDLNRKARDARRARISIRSSAIGEDGRLTFAGQYETCLNVPLEQVHRRYKDIVASKFSPRALFYLHTHGFREEEIAMSVGCFNMVDAVAAGVAYTVNPTDADLDKMMVSGVWGLGKPVVDGTMTPDLFLLSRRPGRGLLESRVARKEWRLVPGKGEGLEREEVPAEDQGRPCLTEEQLGKLSEYLRALELHYRCPQDVEWALDRTKRFYILQTRPLRLADWGRGVERALPEGRYPVLLEGGQTASPGAGCGPVFLADLDTDLGAFPRGAVLVARQTSPRFVEVMTRAAAIVTDVGSATGHMASLAREYRVPTIVDAGRATATLRPSAEVTVDATRRRVYGGRVEELLLEEPAAVPSGEGPSLALLERVVGRVARLNLIDPSKSSFRAKSCRTYHDVTRFCHEMAIGEIFNLNDYRNLSSQAMAFRLESEIPLGIYLIDLGGGLEARPDTRVVRPEQITSVPMRALWRGMTTPGVKWAGARPIDLKGFVSVWANTMYDAAKSERGLGTNSYALVAASYLNFGSRLGYHFTTLDSSCGDAVDENYILFRFKGGAADIERRVRRTRFVAEALLRHRFEVDQKEDLLNAWVKRLPREETEDRLALIGRLIGCARQLDVVMDGETTLDRCVQAFVEGDFAFFEFKEEP